VQLLDGHLRVREALVKGPLHHTQIQDQPPPDRTRPAHQTAPRRTLASDRLQRGRRPRFAHPQKGTPLDPARLAREHLKPAVKKAGITKPFRAFHDLRHTALTHEAAAGNPLSYIQMKAGHSQTSITERYTHAAQVQFAGAAARAEERMFSNTSH
jgi:integrase